MKGYITVPTGAEPNPLNLSLVLVALGLILLIVTWLTLSAGYVLPLLTWSLLISGTNIGVLLILIGCLIPLFKYLTEAISVSPKAKTAIGIVIVFLFFLLFVPIIPAGNSGSACNGFDCPPTSSFSSFAYFFSNCYGANLQYAPPFAELVFLLHAECQQQV